MAVAERSVGQTKELAVIIMGSEADKSKITPTADLLHKFGSRVEVRVGSAHKTPTDVIELVAGYNYEECPTVIIAAVGRQHALGPFIDFRTHFPVIALCLLGDRFSVEDAISALRIPSGIGVTVTTEPEAAAIAAAKILGLTNKLIRDRVMEYQKAIETSISNSDATVREEFRQKYAS